jgi:hypothetical protein
MGMSTCGKIARVIPRLLALLQEPMCFLHFHTSKILSGRMEMRAGAKLIDKRNLSPDRRPPVTANEAAKERGPRPKLGSALAGTKSRHH